MGREQRGQSPEVKQSSARRVWLGAIGRLCVAFFGQLHWQAPRWLVLLVQRLRSSPKLTLLLFVAVVGGSYGLQQAYHWYAHRPHPQGVLVQIEAPKVTDYAKTPIHIHALTVHFSESVAPLALADKPAGPGLELEPRLAGRWQWEGDDTLHFLPQSDWPIGQKFRLRIRPNEALRKGIQLEQTRFDFSTEPFRFQVESREFYQDPEQPLNKFALYTLQFNYPVSPETLEKAVSLHLRLPDKDWAGIFRQGGAVPAEIHYDARQLRAFIRSAKLSTALNSQSLLLRVAKGVRSQRGGEACDQALESIVTIPGLYSLTLDKMAVTLVNDDQGVPQQTLVMESSTPISGKELQAHTRAWILPTTDDAGRQHADWSVGDVSAAVLQRAQPLTLDLQPTERDAATLQAFRLRAPPQRMIYVEVRRGLSAVGGYQLGKTVTQVIAVPDYPKLVRFLGSGAILPLQGDHRVSVVARNLRGVRLRIGRLQPEQLQHLVSLNQGSFSRPDLRIGADHLVERFTEEVALPQGDPSQAHYQGFDLSRYLGSGDDGKRGVFLLQVVPWDPAHPQREEGDVDPFDNTADHSDDVAQDRRLIVVTDLGLVVKRNGDGSREVFVQSLRSGRPVAGAVLRVLAENGETLRSGSTDSDGHLHLASLAGFQREKRPVAFTVTGADGRDFSFLPIGASDRDLSFSRFAVGGAPNARSAGDLEAFLFSDRGLYRPGEEIHLGLIVRAADWQRDVSGVPLEVQLSDARGTVVTKEHLTSDRDGFLGWNYRSADNAPTGTWTATLYLLESANRRQQLGSTSIQIKDFEPDQTRLRAVILPAQREGWVKPAHLQAELQADTLYGTPAAGRRVAASLHLQPAVPRFTAWRAYSFYDSRQAKTGYDETLQEVKTDAQGAARIPLDLSSYAPATYALAFYAQVFEPGSGRSVAAEAHTLISSADYLVGVKSDDALEFIPRDAKRKVQIVAIDPRLRAVAPNGLQAVILERHYVSVLTKQDSGVYRYESRRKETTIRRSPLALRAGPSDLVLPTERPGNFSLVIEGPDGRRLNRVDYSVAGNANLSRSLEHNAELELQLDKPDYAPGERIAVAIRAPYAGSGLITIERDRVYAWTWFHADSSASVQYITVPKDLEGNGYVNVQFLRDPASSEIFTSPLSYGVAPFSVNRQARTEPVQVQAPERIKPGQTLDFIVHTSGRAQVAVFAVDAGILQVAHYHLENPLDYFLRKRMLDVQSAQILDLILPSFRQFLDASHTGGDADASGRQQLNPFKSKHEEPVAWWSGIVTVDGSRHFRYTVPDSFNGRLKLMAVAVTPERMGTAEGATTVRGDFVLSPNLPTAVAPGDVFDASVQVVNNLPGGTPGGDDLRVTLKSGEGLVLEGPAEQTLRIAPGQSGLAHFRLRALARLGPSILRYGVSAAGHSAARQLGISVRPAVPLLTELQIGRLKPGAQQVIAPLEDFYPQHSERLVTLAYSPLVLSQGLGLYLQHYSHYCSEQLLSMSTPALISARQPEFAQSPEMAARAPAIIAQALATLRNRQNSEGGFGVWTATPVADPFISAYAMDFLLQAQQAGLAVPGDMIDQGMRYLRDMAADDGLGSLSELRARAYAIYLLTRSGQVTSNLVAGVQQRLQSQYPAQWKDDLAAVYLAASYQLLKQEEIAGKLIQGPWQRLQQHRSDDQWDYDYYDDPLIRRAQTLRIVEGYFPRLAEKITPDLLEALLRPIQEGRYNSLSAALTLMALADLPQGQRPPLGLGLAQSRQSAKTTTFTAFGQVRGSLLQGRLDPASTALRLSHGQSSGENTPAWYSVSQSGFLRNPPRQAKEEGLEILREYRDAQGQPIQKLALGQELMVHIRLRSQGSTDLRNVAIVDILPGGFEVVANPPYSRDASGGEEPSTGTVSYDPLAQPGSTMRPDYVDVRDDRVLLYTTATTKVQEYVYRIRATTVGNFGLAPIYAESLYDRRKRAYAPVLGHMEVVSAAAPSSP